MQSTRQPRPQLTAPLSGAGYFFRGISLATQPGTRRFVIFPLLITAAVTSATEFVSNVAMSSIILPVLANLGPTSANLGLIPATLACSCAFMLPSATPPNALAYGSGFLTMKDMVTSGLVMNVVGISLITFWSIFVAPIFFPEYSTAI